MTQRLARIVATFALVALSGMGWSAPAGAQSTTPVVIPETSAGRVLRAWLEAFNSNDSVPLQAYFRRYQPEAPTKGWLQVQRNTGGFELQKVFVSEPLHVEFLVKERKSAAFARGALDVGSGDPVLVQSFSIRPIPPGANPEGCKSYQAAPATPAGAADPKDVASEDAILAALYEAISGPACQRRDWNRFRSLFAPGARLMPTNLGPDRRAAVRVLTPDEYAATARQGLEEYGFFEREIARTGETFGSITHAFSVYESRRTANDDKPFSRGINSIQLLNDGTRWWVVSVYWQSERPDLPIPPQYLGGAKK